MSGAGAAAFASLMASVTAMFWLWLRYRDTIRKLREANEALTSERDHLLVELADARVERKAP